MPDKVEKLKRSPPLYGRTMLIKNSKAHLLDILQCVPNFPPISVSSIRTLWSSSSHQLPGVVAGAVDGLVTGLLVVGLMLVVGQFSSSSPSLQSSVPSQTTLLNMFQVQNCFRANLL